MKLKNTKLSGGATIPELTPATGFETVYRSSTAGQRARRGFLRVNGRQIETPALFPVINLLSGPPPLHRNGATHKFLKRQLMFEDHRPTFMSEVLHFTDYPMSPRGFRTWFPHSAGGSDVKTLDYWVQQSRIELGQTEQPYHPLFFLDSGGFRLLFNRDVDISAFGYQPTQESILQLQLDYGADIIASLDFPIPPFLSQSQVEERIEKSTNNAVTLMELLYRHGRTDPTGKRPFPILAVHGQTPQQMRSSIIRLLSALAEAGFTTEPFGIGIGSLVPLRISSDSRRIVILVEAAVATLRSSDIPVQFDPDRIVIHAFGITGDMIPVLTHLGVDTFDSSSYIKSASVLDYYDPTTWTSLNFRKLEALSCNCNACIGINPQGLKQLQDVLAGERIDGHKERLGLQIGNFEINIKSDVYGLIAYHNLNLQDREITGVRQAILADETAQHLVRFSQVHARAQALAEFVAEIDPQVNEALGHVQVELLPRTREEIDQQYNTISLANDPSAFNINQQPNYTVPDGKDRLLLLACSKAKPYRHAKSQSVVLRFLQQHVGTALESCHKVTLSGLYGPVPREFEDIEAVRTYEYILSATAKQQRELVIARLVAYLEAHLHAYQQIVAYVTAGAYRSVVETAFARVRENYARIHGTHVALPTPLILAPAKSRGTGTKDLLNHVHLAELLACLYPEIPPNQELLAQLRFQTS